MSDSDGSSLPDSSLITLPDDIWIRIGRLLDNETLKGLLGLNRLFFSLAMDAKYHNLTIFSNRSKDEGGQTEAISKFMAVMNHLREEQERVGPHVRQISTEGDLFETLLPRSEAGMLARLSHMFTARPHTVATPDMIHSAFEHCRNVQVMDITFNGWRPGMFIEADPGMESIYSHEQLVYSILEALCHAFQTSLRQLQIALDNRHKVRFVLKAPALKFPRLQVLQLRLYRNAKFDEPWDEVFTDFISQFSPTLLVLKLRISGPGPCPLDVMLGGNAEFPLLHTLEIKSHTAYESARGLPLLNAFFSRTPSLKNLTVIGPCFQRHEQLGQDTLLIPPTIQLSSFGTSEEIWRTHHAHLIPIFDVHPPKKFSFQMDLQIASRQRLFKQSLTEGLFFLHFVEELHLQMDELNISSVVLALAELFPKVHTLVIECEYALIPRPGGHHGSFDAVRFLSDEAVRRVMASTKDKVAYPDHPLRSLDIVRRVKGFTADSDEMISCCTCPEIRFWGAMKVFVDYYFPSIAWVGGDARVYAAEHINDAMLDDQTLAASTNEPAICEDCATTKPPQLTGRGVSSRIRW